jgi:hypothetical protein
VTHCKSTLPGLRLGIIGAAAACALLVSGISSAASCPQKLKAEDHVVALNAIQNLMGRYSHLGELRGEGTLMELFAMKTEGVSWRTPTGPSGIKDMMGRFNKPGEEAPGLVPGQLHMHSMLTPVIEIAADGKTAKGVWDSFGPNIQTGNEVGNWLWTKYGVDFIKEEGVWKIWHLQVYAMFNTPYDKSITVSAKERAERMASGGGAGGPGGPPPGAPPGAAPGGPQGPAGPAMGGPGQNWTGPKDKWIYDGTSAPRGPKIPEPYCTFDPADSYGNI